MSSDPSARIPLSEIAREMKARRETEAAEGRPILNETHKLPVVAPMAESQESPHANPLLSKGTKAVLWAILVVLGGVWGYVNFWLATFPKDETAASNRKQWEEVMAHAPQSGNSESKTSRREEEYRAIRQRYAEAHPEARAAIEHFTSYYVSEVERHRKNRAITEGGYFRPGSDQSGAVPFGPEYSVDLIAKHLETVSAENREVLTKYITQFMGEAKQLHEQHPDWPLRKP